MSRHFGSTVVVAILVSLALSGCDSTPTHPTLPNCSWTVNSNTTAFPAGGGPGTASVATASGCTWSASSNQPWLAITSSASGSGPGTVQFTVSANADSASRTCMLSIGGQPVSISQEGRTPSPCTFEVAPRQVDVGVDGGTASIGVTTAAGCNWTAAETADWLSVTAGASGTGNGQVTVTALANSSSNGRETMLLVAGLEVRVRQPGRQTQPQTCDYSLAPVEFALDHRGRTDSQAPITITTQAGCAWVAAADTDWITASPASGEGPGSIRFSVSPYDGEVTRRAAIRVRWNTVTAGQNVWITQTGCHYYITPTTVEVAAGGGTGRIDVWNSEDVCPSGCGCPWTASSPVSWVRILTSMPRYGDDSVGYEVQPNTGAARSATITVAGKTVVIAQKGV